MTALSVATAALGVALAGYPLLLAPGRAGVLVAAVSGLCLLAALLWPTTALAAAAAVAVGCAYGAALLGGDVALDPFGALFGTGWLLLIEGLSARAAGPPRPARATRRVRLLYTAAVAVAGCIAAHLALLAGAVSLPETTWTPLVPVAAAAGALVALVSLAVRALERGR